MKVIFSLFPHLRGPGDYGQILSLFICFFSLHFLTVILLEYGVVEEVMIVSTTFITLGPELQKGGILVSRIPDIF